MLARKTIGRGRLSERKETWPIKISAFHFSEACIVINHVSSKGVDHASWVPGSKTVVIELLVNGHYIYINGANTGISQRGLRCKDQGK